jgi:peptidoglycan/LPS O-acetylase OafA/YrhL
LNPLPGQVRAEFSAALHRGLSMGAIRLFLAYGVLLGHECEYAVNFQISCDAHWSLNVIGGRSVVLFYIVSGFLMSYVLDSKYPRTRVGTYQFYKSRFLRIYPLWWFMVIFSTVAVSAAWLHQSLLGVVSAIFLFGSDWLVPFWHYPEGYFGFFPTRTEIGWTLGAEMTFYLLAPWLLRSDRLALAALVGSLAVRIVVFFVVGPHAPMFNLYIIWSYFFLPSTFMFFMLGHLARRVPYIGTAGPWSAFAILIAAVWFVSRKGWGPVDDWFRFNDYMAAVLFALALPGVFEATKNNRVSNWLGDLTYPLYLTHHMTMFALFGVWAFLGAPGVAFVNFAKSFSSPYTGAAVLFALVTITCLPVALVVHVLVELPLRFVTVRLLAGLETMVWRSRATVVPVVQPAVSGPGSNAD